MDSGELNKGRKAGEEKLGEKRYAERYSERQRRRDREGFHALSALSNGVGVERLISLKPAELPGTCRYFPYNIRELETIEGDYTL